MENIAYLLAVHAQWPVFPNCANGTRRQPTVRRQRQKNYPSYYRQMLSLKSRVPVSAWPEELVELKKATIAWKRKQQKYRRST
jgi:hypothetical protein